MPTRVKILENIRSREDLNSLIELYKADGAEVGWSEQPDGLFRLEAAFQDPSEQRGTIRSRVSGKDLHPA
jgi:hypothetical protein